MDEELKELESMIKWCNGIVNKYSGSKIANPERYNSWYNKLKAMSDRYDKLMEQRVNAYVSELNKK